MNPPTTDEVPCNGSCRRRFRPASVNMDRTAANVLLSSNRPAGLLWLCPECHRSFNMQQTVKHCGFDLPPELWVMIFQSLDTRSTLRVRLTCRRWKNIVDQNKCLREKFRISFDEEVIVDEDFLPQDLIPASSASFYQSKISAVCGWWPSFGTGLIQLYLGSCEIALPALLGMLRQTPNLTSLILCPSKYTSTEETDVDFRLENLEYFKCDEVFDIFGKIFPRLRVLNLAHSQTARKGEEKACRLLQSVQGTLKNLECRLTPLMLEQMASMNRLQLTNVSHQGAGDLAVQLSEMQGTIEYLNVIATFKDLSEIGRNLNKLKGITAAIYETGTVIPSFLANMPQLTLLCLQRRGLEPTFLSFERFKSVMLNKLKLESFTLVGDGFRDFLTACPNLRELELYQCSLDSWSDIFSAELTSLRCLKMWDLYAAEDFTSILKKLYNLSELEISGCDIAKDVLVEILLQCPQLRYMTLSSMNTLTDEVVGIVIQFPLLTQLIVVDCPLTDKSVKLIADHRSSLIAHLLCMGISDVAKSLLSHIMESRISK